MREDDLSKYASLLHLVNNKNILNICNDINNGAGILSKSDAKEVLSINIPQKKHNFKRENLPPALIENKKNDNQIHIDIIIIMNCLEYIKNENEFFEILNSISHKDTFFYISCSRGKAQNANIGIFSNLFNKYKKLKVIAKKQLGDRFEWINDNYIFGFEKNRVINKKKPRIALIIDTENWAFANISNQISKNLSKYYEFTIIPTEKIKNIVQLLIMTKDFDITHFFWRESLRLIQSSQSKDYIHHLGYNKDDFFFDFINKRVITSCVYDHLYLNNDDINLRIAFYNSIIKGYTVSSKKLLNIYSSIPVYPKPLTLAEDGVDLSLFYKNSSNNTARMKDRPLIVGWAGNSKWSSELEDFKGYHSILLPAIKILKDEGIDISLHIADRNYGFIPHIDMVNYYNSIDVYVCPSKIEGTPNPILEAMACGIPIISTDVGVVRDVFGPLQSRWILDSRDVLSLVNMLRDFYLDRENLISQLSSENIKSIKSWSWKNKSKNFKLFFDSFIFGS